MKPSLISATLVLGLLSIICVVLASDSCVARCGQKAVAGSCGCDRHCGNNCCGDYKQVCYSCKSRCGAAPSPNLACQCNDGCKKAMNCCNDYTSQCGGGGGNKSVSDAQLKNISNFLSLHDDNAVGLGAGGVVLNLQAKMSGGGHPDNSPAPLISSIPALTADTYATFLKLRPHFNPNANVDDSPKGADWDLINAFVNATMQTTVMKTLEAFAAQHRLLKGNVSLQQQMTTMWFGTYSRAANHQTPGSSGFEHVFMGELPAGGDVGGFHNWLSYYMEETAGRANYLGYKEETDMGTKAVVNLVDSFTWRGRLKPTGGYLIGSSVEHDLAVFTLCWLSRPNKVCPVQSHGVDYKVQTYVEEHNGQRLVGSAYPI